MFRINNRFVWVAIVFSSLAMPQQVGAQTLTLESAEAWQKHIKPTEDELAWTRISWHRDLKSGLDEARKIGKPILLWTMNGHPFACT